MPAKSKKSSTTKKLLTKAGRGKTAAKKKASITKKTTLSKKAALKKTSVKKATKGSVSKAKPRKTSAGKKTVIKKARSQKLKAKGKVIAKKSKALKKTVAKTTQAKKKVTPIKPIKPKIAKIKAATSSKIAAKKLTTAKPITKTKFKAEIKKTTKAKKKTMEKIAVSPISNVIEMRKPAGEVKIFGVDPYQLVADEAYMNDAQQVHFRQILLNWKKELMEEVDRTMHHMKDDAQRYADPSDLATQEEEFNLELRTRDRERKLIKKIDEALERIEQDEYGFCDACGIDIGIRRLEARPTATLCIDCKTLDEIREKQTRA